jgi:hypothetical protein
VADGFPHYIPWQQDDVEWYPWIWTANHLGPSDEGLIYRSYDPATGRHDFRAVTSPNHALGGLRKPETTETEVRLRGNDFWGNIRFLECGGDDGYLIGILAIRDGLSSWHADASTLPDVPEGVTAVEQDIMYANCHCCGEGP